jgi:superfamily II DNA/RNA helicase
VTIKILKEHSLKTILFCETKKGVDELFYYLSNEVDGAVALHGDKNQF